jgi:hypothetical protein
LEHDDELAMLVGVLVKTGQTLLKKQRGEFIPFAAFTNSDGKAEMLGADIGIEQPESTDVIDFLRGTLRAMAQQQKIKASGICANVTARLPGYGDKVDAICCFIERASQPPMDFYVPFRKGFLGNLKYEKPIALPGSSMVFPLTGGIA